MQYLKKGRFQVCFENNPLITLLGTLGLAVSLGAYTWANDNQPTTKDKDAQETICGSLKHSHSDFSQRSAWKNCKKQRRALTKKCEALCPSNGSEAGVCRAASASGGRGAQAQEVYRVERITGASSTGSRYQDSVNLGKALEKLPEAKANAIWSQVNQEIQAKWGLGSAIGQANASLWNNCFALSNERAQKCIAKYPECKGVFGINSKPFPSVP